MASTRRTSGNSQPIIVDAANQTLGRLATSIAVTLRGKDKVTFAPNVVPNVQVVVTNASQLRFTGTKLTGKLYHHFSGYPGGLKTTTLKQELERDPVKLVRRAVAQMLPKNRLNARFMRNLKVFSGSAR